MSNRKYYTEDHNVKNITAIKVLENLNSKYTQHMFEKNRVVEAMAKHFEGGIDLLKKPVCPHCEKPGQWHCDFVPFDPNAPKECIECQDMQMEFKEVTGQIIEVHGELTSKDIPVIGCCWCEQHGKSTFAISMKQYLKDHLNIDEKDLLSAEKIIYGSDGNAVSRTG